MPEKMPGTQSGGLLRCDGDLLDATGPDHVHDPYQAINARIPIAIDDDIKLGIRGGLRLYDTRQCCHGVHVAIDLQVTIFRERDHQMFDRFHLLGLTGLGQLRLEPGDGDDVQADHDEKDQQEHHHVDHRDDFDLYAAAGFVVEIEHGLTLSAERPGLWAAKMTST